MFSEQWTFMTMASKVSILCFFFLLGMLFSSSLSVATSTAPDTICSSAHYPSFCKSNLPPNEDSNTKESGRHFVRQSLSSARDFRLLVESYLKPHSSYSEPTIHALQDCQLLAVLNVDFFSTTFQTINFTSSLNSLQAEDSQTLLSATLTNLETCYDGLQEELRTLA